MPKKAAKKPEEKTESGLGEVISLLKDLNEEIKGLGSRVDSLENLRTDKTATQQIGEVIASKGDDFADATVPELVLPPKHRQIVVDILGEQFKAWEDFDKTPSTHFLFNIEIPRQLSSIPKEQHARANCDHERNVCKLPSDVRSKAVSYAEGDNGVRTWCLKIRQNLNQFYAKEGIRSPFTEIAE